MTSLKSYDSSSGQSLDLSDWKGLYVNVQAIQMGSVVLAEGEVTQANPMLMILDRGKGKNQLMIEAREISYINEIRRPVVVPKITVRTLSAVAEDAVRQHLADRHGFLLTSIPAEAGVAAMVHEDHHQFGLGHRHDNAIEPALTSDVVIKRAAELDNEHAMMLECLSCGYYRGVGDEGREFSQVNGKLDEDGQPAYHCENCKDEEEFKYS